MEVMTVDTCVAGRRRNEHHWYEAVAHPIKATFGPHVLGSEDEMSFAVHKYWSYTDPRKTQRLRSGAKQPPTHQASPLRKWLRHFWPW